MQCKRENEQLISKVKSKLMFLKDLINSDNILDAVLGN